MRAVRAAWIRGGTSKGLFFQAHNRVLSGPCESLASAHPEPSQPTPALFQFGGTRDVVLLEARDLPLQGPCLEGEGLWVASSPVCAGHFVN